MREHARSLKAVTSLPPMLRSGGAFGAGVDRLGYESVTFVVTVGTWVDGAQQVVFDESEDGVSFTPIAADKLTGQAPYVASADASNVAGVVGYTGDARYVRARVFTGYVATAGANMGACVLLGRARSRPAGSGLA